MSDPTYWHFASDALRDGSPLPEAGTMLPVIWDVEPRSRGYHASTRPIDALQYAPGPFVAIVRLRGTMISHGDPADKVVAQQRQNVTAYVDVSDTLRAFARKCAEDVLHLWTPPNVVVEYLKTGDEEFRDAARGAAWDAARGAAGAAWDATRAAAWAAARDAARAAARAAAGDTQNQRLETMLREALS